MSSKPVLRVDWCSHEAAKYAVEHWHYSQVMPAAKLVKIGAWEDGTFIGVVIFGRGATNALVKPYGLSNVEGCELVRIALNKHATPVSRIVSIAIKMLKQGNPKLRLIVSFADPEQGHVGGVYQAGGWVYTGRTSSADEYVVNGRRLHGRSFRSLYGRCLPAEYAVVKGSSKYRYLYALDDQMQKQIAPLAKPYPKRSRAEGVDSDTPAVHAGEGGAIPTSALQTGAD